ncbi:MAG: hypothetical protein SAL70_35055, partial [Scytonema sp. PMC 1070.18]|nr:hypothetical protein [Scytonema sp. PMC 1070.18]
LKRTLTGHTGKVTSVSFSPDGQTLGSASDDKTIKLWSLDGQLKRTLDGYSAAFTSVTFSSDSKILASGSDDATIKLWRLDNSQPLSTLIGHNYAVNSISFSPDSNTLVAADANNKIILWNFNLDNLLAKSCQLVHDYLKTNPNNDNDIHMTCKAAHSDED